MLHQFGSKLHHAFSGVASPIGDYIPVLFPYQGTRCPAKVIVNGKLGDTFPGFQALNYCVNFDLWGLVVSPVLLLLRCHALNNPLPCSARKE